MQMDTLGHAYTCMILKCDGGHRSAKISETQLPLPCNFCPPNNTFQNIPF